MLKLLSLCLFDDQMLPMVSDHGCVSEGGTEKHQNCVTFSKLGGGSMECGEEQIHRCLASRAQLAATRYYKILQ